MSDMMTFPDTVEEFMEQYKIVDEEEIYTNGTELVPIFRMRQWFEHLPSAQPEKLYTKADYIMALHKEYGCSLTRAEEAHNKALEYLQDETMMKGGVNEKMPTVELDRNAIDGILYNLDDMIHRESARGGENV